MRPPPSRFCGFDPEHNIDGVTIENLRFNGQTISSASDAHLAPDAHVKNVNFKSKD